MVDVTIIGAGVAGLWAARSCLARGLRPRLADRSGPPGPHTCSWWAGGMLAPECEGATAETPIISHGRKAAALWGDVTTVSTQGTLVLAPERDRAELDRFAVRTIGHVACDGDAIAALEPDLGERHKRGLFFAKEAHLDPRQALSDLVRSLAALGVFIEQTEITPDNVQGPVIDCRGLAAQGDLQGLRGVRGEMIVLQSDEIMLTRPVRLLHPRHPLYVVPRANGLFMLGATQIESAARGPMTARSALELLSAAYALDARFAEAVIIEMGADLRPAFADNVPRVVQRGHVMHLNGLFRHGFLMAPALAEQAATFLSTGKTGDLFREN
ncbi:putative thiamine biosynthesis protein ThiO [Octadecabacter antarcticus 307]|uniref:D-amino-acid oxidase n=1 Tax=Octadecabacter antarcticus 307 TaxID=391626 RepID=M9R5K0_9RHOB|nr:FAD-dependent oxidoreductase [Octadecabacter antarcticus]AGI67909.1 putative thiamine biosynthesis protein ThiO [Octadecabacter antarcticus 307]